jgi:hypothetical protein
MSPLLGLRRDCDENPSPTWSLLAPGSGWPSTSLRQEWRELLVARDDPLAIDQPSEWFDSPRDNDGAGGGGPTSTTVWTLPLPLADNDPLNPDTFAPPFEP